MKRIEWLFALSVLCALSGNVCSASLYDFTIVGDITLVDAGNTWSVDPLDPLAAGDQVLITGQFDADLIADTAVVFDIYFGGVNNPPNEFTIQVGDQSLLSTNDILYSDTTALPVISLFGSPTDLDNALLLGVATNFGTGNGEFDFNSPDPGGLLFSGGQGLAGEWISFKATAIEQGPVVPIPAAFPLFASALGLLGFLGFRRRNTAA